MNGRFLTAKEARLAIGVHSATLRSWANRGLIKVIRTPGGDRRYNVAEFVSKQGEYAECADADGQQAICYCRVSSYGQKDDLERQVAFMQEKYPNHRIIKDVGSGINFKRKGLCTLLELACKGLVSEVVVAYRDRLCRFAFELIERIFHQHGVRIVVLNESVEPSSQSELAEDLLAIINVYACRVNGKRKYTKGKSKDENTQVEEVQQTSSEHVEEDSSVSDT